MISHVKFAEWAALFSEGLFVMLRVYADESGSVTLRVKAMVLRAYSLRIRPDARILGCLFVGNGKKVLNDYRAPYFHFRELANKYLRAKKGSPYYGWSDKQLMVSFTT